MLNYFRKPTCDPLQIIFRAWLDQGVLHNVWRKAKAALVNENEWNIDESKAVFRTQSSS